MKAINVDVKNFLWRLKTGLKRNLLVVREKYIILFIF